MSKFTLTYNSVTSAFHLVPMAIYLKKGDTIIVPLINFIAIYNMVKFMEAKNLFSRRGSSYRSNDSKNFIRISWGWSRSQGFGCSPIKVVRELGSERRETVWSLSAVGVDT